MTLQASVAAYVIMGASFAGAVAILKKNDDRLDENLKRFHETCTRKREYRFPPYYPKEVSRAIFPGFEG